MDVIDENYNLDFYNFFASVAKDLNCTIKSLCNNYVLEVFSIDKNKRFYIIGNSLPLNNNVAQKICSDKSATSVVLKKNNIDCVEHFLLKNPALLKDWNDSIFDKILKEYKIVVVKDNNGSCGNLIFKANSIKDAKRYAQLIFNQNKDVCLSPFLNYTKEYRLIMLNNKCEICFAKEKPFVIGDGKNNLNFLVEKKFGKNACKKLEFEKKYKPKKDEKYVVGWKNNLKMFAGVEDIQDKILKRKLEGIAKACTKALDINFCSVDIVEAEGKLKVLEINSIVSVLGYAGSSANRLKQSRALFKKAFQEQLK